MPSDRQDAAVVLYENKPSDPIALTIEERDQLRALVPKIALNPEPGFDGSYSVNPGNFVGAVQVGETRFELRSKLPIRRLLFLMSYSMDPKNWRRLGFDFDEEKDLFEAIIPGFVFQLEEALRQGLKSGYQSEDDALQTVRGRIRFNDQIRNRFGLLPPVECTYDEFTDDIEINRLLKAALLRLGEIRIRNPESRSRLAGLAGAFANVTPITYDPRAIPEVHYDRLNEHFRRPVELARLILRSRSLDAHVGKVGGAAFVVNLSVVFEEFVHAALRQSLGLGVHAFPRQGKGRMLHLDKGRKLSLEPDLSWWDVDKCVFIGDVKYKMTPATAGVQHPDAYQLLAYTTAADIDRGLLVYAAGDAHQEAYDIPFSDKQIEVVTMNLDQSPDGVLDQIDWLASRIRERLPVLGI